MSACLEYAIGERAHQSRFGPAVYERVSVGANPIAQLLHRGQKRRIIAGTGTQIHGDIHIWSPLLWRTTFVLALASTILAHATRKIGELVTIELFQMLQIVHKARHGVLLAQLDKRIAVVHRHARKHGDIEDTDDA